MKQHAESRETAQVSLREIQKIALVILLWKKKVYKTVVRNSCSGMKYVLKLELNKSNVQLTEFLAKLPGIGADLADGVLAEMEVL